MIHATDLVLGTTYRRCDRCNEITFWFKSRQRTKGWCDHHAAHEPVDLATAARQLITTLGLTWCREELPEIFAPGEYAKRREKVIMHGRFLISGQPLYAVAEEMPRDAGPCDGCRQVIRRYGPDAYPLCSNCERGRNA